MSYLFDFVKHAAGDRLAAGRPFSRYGLATEATRAALHLGQIGRGLERAASITHVRNDSPGRIMAKPGMRRSGRRSLPHLQPGSPGPRPGSLTHRGQPRLRLRQTKRNSSSGGAIPDLTSRLQGGRSARSDLALATGNRAAVSLTSSLIHPRTPASICVYRSSLSRQMDLRSRPCTMIRNPEKRKVAVRSCP
jgi:hypothetical protein